MSWIFEESRDGDKLELAFEKLIENTPEAIRGLPVEFVTENDGAGLRLRQNGVGDFVLAGLRPVAGVDAPKDNAQTVLPREVGLIFSERTVGWTKSGGSVVEDFGKDVLRAGQFGFDLRVGHFAELRVGEAVIANLMTFGEDAPDQIGRGGGALANHKETGGEAAFLESIEDQFGYAGRRAIVEGKGDAIALRRPAFEKGEI